MSRFAHMLRAIRFRARNERGQMLIIFAMLIVPVSFVLAAIAVDASVWQSERRGAQKDADLSSLAGALELVRSRDQAAAESAAISNADTNDEAGNATAPVPSANASAPNTVVVDDACFPGNQVLNPNSVSVNLDHESQTFFSSIFGVNVAPDIGAHARACAGAAQSPASIVPIEIDLTRDPCFFPGTGLPNVGAACPIEYGSNNGPNDSRRGILDLQAPGDYCSDASGSGDLEDLIEFGAPGTCLINPGPTCDPDQNGPWYDCVAVQSGNPTKVARAFEARIAREGACDTDGDGIEEFDEVVTLVFDSSDPSKDVYEPRDCDLSTDDVQMSPRLITIIVLESPPDLNGSNAGYPIYAFAGMYVIGCNQNAVDESGMDPECETPGGGHTSAAPYPGGPMFVRYPKHHRCGHTTSPTCTPIPTSTQTPLPTATDTPVAPTATSTPDPGEPTPTPTDGESDCGNGQGCVVVWGRLVNLIFAGHEAGPPTDATTIFSISLVE